MLDFWFSPSTLTFAGPFAASAHITYGQVEVLFSTDSLGNVVDGPVVLEHLLFSSQLYLDPTQLALSGNVSFLLSQPINGTLSAGQLDFGGQAGVFESTSYMLCSGGAPCEAVNAVQYPYLDVTDSAVISNMTLGGALRGTVTGIDFPLPVDPVLLGQLIPGGLSAFTATLTFAAAPEPGIASLAAVALALVSILRSRTVTGASSRAP